MGVDTSLQMYVGEPNSVDYLGVLACGLNLQVISLMTTEYITPNYQHPDHAP